MKLPTPQSSGYLRAMVNAENSINLYDETTYLGPEVLITDLGATLSGTDVLVDFPETHRWARQRLPNALIGAYHSSRCVQADPSTYNPWKEFLASCYASGELLSTDFLDAGRRIIDYSQSAVKDRAVAQTLNWCIDHDVKLLFSDNWSHPSQLAGYIPWSYTVAYMQSLASALAAFDIPVIANIAGWMAASQADAQQVGCLAGISIEDLFGADVLTSSGVVSALLTKIASISPTIMVAIPSDVSECDFYAHMAMLFDHVWVACPYTASISPLVSTNWPNLPTLYGRPLGPYTFSNGLAYRSFANGKLLVDTLHQTYSFR